MVMHALSELLTFCQFALRNPSSVSVDGIALEYSKLSLCINLQLNLQMTIAIYQSMGDASGEETVNVTRFLSYQSSTFLTSGVVEPQQPHTDSSRLMSAYISTICMCS